MNINWDYSPLCDLYYRNHPATEDNKLPPIITADDVDKVVLHTMKERIRFKKPGDENFRIIPVIFYNENDRLKTMKESPFIIVKPSVPLPVSDYIQTDDQIYIPTVNPNDEVFYNTAPTWYEFAYTITVGCDVWPQYRRLQTFINSVLFGLRYGQRRIQTNDCPGGTNFREIVFENENSSEDFERNYFQYDFQFHFRMPLNVQEWTALPRIDELVLDVQHFNALNIDGVQIVSDANIDKTTPPGLVIKVNQADESGIAPSPDVDRFIRVWISGGKLFYDNSTCPDIILTVVDGKLYIDGAPIGAYEINNQGQLIYNL